MLILSVSKIRKRTFPISNLIVIFKELSKIFKSFQNMLTFGQWKKRCSMVSSSFSQKSHKGESTFLNLNSKLFVYKILFNIFYWNSLNLVSNVVLKGSRYIFCQSNWNVCVLKASLYFFCAVGILDILETKLSYNNFDLRFWKLTFFPSIRNLKSVRIRSWVSEEMEVLLVFNILRHSSSSFLWHFCFRIYWGKCLVSGSVRYIVHVLHRFLLQSAREAKMSRQTTLGRFGFKKSISHRNSVMEKKVPDLFQLCQGQLSVII